MKKTLWKRLGSEKLSRRLMLTVAVITVVIATVTASGIWWNATKITPNNGGTNTTYGNCSGIITGDINAEINQNCK